MLQKKLSFILPLSRIHKKLYLEIMGKHRENLESSSNLIVVNGKPLHATSGKTTIPFNTLKEKLKQYKGIKPNESSLDQLSPEQLDSCYSLYYSIYLDKEKKQKEEQHFSIELVLAEEQLKKKDWNSLLTKNYKKKDIFKELAGTWHKYLSLEKDPTSNEYTIVRKTDVIDEYQKKMGITILLSSSQRDSALLLSMYRQRDRVEKVFDAGNAYFGPN
jgi:hypothetical protein